MTTTAVRTGTTTLHFSFREEDLRLTPLGFTEMAKSLRAVLTIGTAAVSFDEYVLDEERDSLLTQAEEETEGFQVERLRYESPFYVAFASSTATCTTAAFAIANLYSRIQHLREERATSNVRVEIHRQVLETIRVHPNDPAVQQLIDYELRRFGREDLPKMLEIAERTTGILERVDNIEVQEGA